MRVLMIIVISFIHKKYKMILQYMHD